MKYDYNRDFAIFDFGESKRPISYQLQLFEYFTLSLITQQGDLSIAEDQKLTTFLVDSLDFLHFEELPRVLRDYEIMYE